MALSRLTVSCVFIAEAALTLFLIGYTDHRDLAPTEADRPVAASTES